MWESEYLLIKNGKRKRCIPPKWIQYSIKHLKNLEILKNSSSKRSK
jgi:hypothetical protein